MAYTQFMSEARQLTPAEKFALVELLLRDLRDAVAASAPVPMARSLTVEEKLDIVKRLGGFLKPETGSTPTDPEAREGYTDY